MQSGPWTTHAEGCTFDEKNNSDDDDHSDIEDFNSERQDGWGNAPPIASDDVSDAAMIELTDVMPTSIGLDQQQHQQSQQHGASGVPILPPSGLRALLQHRDNTLSKQQDDNRVMMVFIVVVIVLLLVILLKLPGEGSASNDDTDGADGALSPAERAAYNMRPWMIESLDPFSELRALYDDDGSLDDDDPTYALHMMERIALDVSMIETMLIGNDRWFRVSLDNVTIDRIRNVSVNTSVSACVLQRSDVSTQTMLERSLWDWWLLEAPHMSGASTDAALTGRQRWTTDTLWQYIAEAHYAWCRTWISDPRLAQALVFLTMTDLVMGGGGSGGGGAAAPHAASGAAAALLMDLQTQWNGAFGKEWLRVLWNVTTPSRGTPPVSFGPTFSDTIDSNDPLMEIVLRYNTPVTDPIQSALWFVQFLATFQLSAWQARHYFLLHPEPLLLAWNNQSHTVTSLDSLLALHVPLLHVWIPHVEDVGSALQLPCQVQKSL